MVGSLMYAALGSRPDIAFSVTAVSRYNVQPLEMHVTAAKRVLRYLKTIILRNYEYNIGGFPPPHILTTLTSPLSDIPTQTGPEI
jgi:hypothetical protein